jgi:hypothetical protein
LLNYKSGNVIRDTCRTLAVIGNMDVIPSIQPLVDSPDKEIKKDAQDAVAALKAFIASPAFNCKCVTLRAARWKGQKPR